MFGFKKDWRKITIKNNEEDMPIFKEMSPLLRGAKLTCYNLLRNRYSSQGKDEYSKITAFYLGIIVGDLLKHATGPLPKDILHEALFRLAGYIDMLDEDTNTEDDWISQNEKYVKAYFNQENELYRKCGVDYSSYPDVCWNELIEKLNHE